MDEECIHGLGMVAACVICNGKAEKERLAEARVRARFPASYVSLLACGHFSTVGETIATTEPHGLPCCDDDECIERMTRR